MFDLGNLNPANLMQQLQQAQTQLSAQMAKQQEMLERTEVVGQAGGGLVKVYLNGRYATRRVEIDRNLLKDDPEMAEDLTAAAFNDAANRINELRDKQMKSLGGDMLPPGLKLPF